MTADQRRRQLAARASNCPKKPGVYYHKDDQGQIIYVGKSVNLRNRLRSYFQEAPTNSKQRVLQAAIADFDYTVTASEIDALFYEAEMIRRYQPLYNIIGRDRHNHGYYVRITTVGANPGLTLVRQSQNDKASYFGPYFESQALRTALKYLRPIFPYANHQRLPRRACLQYHLGLCPGPETAGFDRTRAVRNLNYLKTYLTGQRRQLISQLESAMSRAAQKQAYEQAAVYRDQLKALTSLSQRTVFANQNPVIDLTSDVSLQGLGLLLNQKPPARIEAIDISHQSGRNNSASLVVFKNGLPAKADYRRFKIELPGNNDVGQIAEVVRRRFRIDNRARWPLPDLLLIDGGRPQLAAAAGCLNQISVTVRLLALAKKQEQIVGLAADRPDQNVCRQLSGRIVADSDRFWQLALPGNSPVVLLLRQIRDESHRFAHSYHRHLKGRQQTASRLLALPGIGPVTAANLLAYFGSYQQLKLASLDQLKQAASPAQAQTIYDFYHHPDRPDRG